MALMNLAVIPLGTGSTSLAGFVSRLYRVLEGEGVTFRLTDMGTIVEGEPQQLFALAARLHEVPFSDGALRVFTQISIDDRRDKQVAIGDKVASVQQKLRAK